jgi:cytochrome b6-f complex iron-sulfur subunit
MALKEEELDGRAAGDGAAASLFGRRDLLTRAGLACLAAATAGGVALGLRALWPRVGTSSSLYVPAFRPEELAVGQVSERLLQEHQVWVVRTAEGFHAFSARCTHLGCRLRLVPSAGEYRCMCHGSFFSLDGDVRRGPAVRPMERVLITLSAEGMLLVDPGVRYRKEHGEWQRPGAFVRYRGSRGG